MEWKSAQKKSKLMTNSHADISMNGQKLEDLTTFKFLGATMCKDGTCSAEVRTRITSPMAAMARLNRIWRCNATSFASKFKFYESLVTSILLNGCEHGPYWLTLRKRSRF